MLPFIFTAQLTFDLTAGAIRMSFSPQCLQSIPEREVSWICGRRLYGTNLDGGGPGMNAALAEFWTSGSVVSLT
ncbi:uncharacterized protein B0T15DRAFT_543136 [Chaetomium strumarium]|uniref:Uncharacterized protein n=1 Tax=Chaetomium strumarium TaxID=1170767 RepID=A0AAJ0GM93_9PEZI|nr:hypothetical protein B0T15DRAFT_543136 [Chaetomium strumarium]